MMSKDYKKHQANIKRQMDSELRRLGERYSSDRGWEPTTAKVRVNEEFIIPGEEPPGGYMLGLQMLCKDVYDYLGQAAQNEELDHAELGVKLRKLKLYSMGALMQLDLSQQTEDHGDDTEEE